MGTPNREETPGYDANLNYKQLHTDVRALIAQVYIIETQFEHGRVRENLYEARSSLGNVEDHILRALGIRGN